MLIKYINKVKKLIGITPTYKSETSKVRSIILPFCQGYGCDIGFGGDKIKKDAIGIDLGTPYANTGHDKVDIPCDVMNEPIPVANSTFDYVYSSHLIEDFENTDYALYEFIRILKDGGNLILVFPDQLRYEKHCRKTGQPLNQYHKHKDMGLTYMKNHLEKLNGIDYEVLLESDCEIDYNVILVSRILKKS